MDMLLENLLDGSSSCQLLTIDIRGTPYFYLQYPLLKLQVIGFLDSR